MTAALRVYMTMIRPAVTYEANTWYTPSGVQGAREGTAKKRQTIRGRCLRVITGAYRATATEALEIETHTIPIDILLETQVSKTMLRLRESQAKDVVGKFTQRIKQQMRSKCGKKVKTRKTLGQRKEEWLRPQITGALQEETKGPPRAPWETISDTPTRRR